MEDYELREQVTEMLLTLANEQHELTTSDFQSRADVVARRIIEIVRANGVTANDRLHIGKKPLPLTSAEINEIAGIQAIQQMWGAQTAEEMAETLRDAAYAVKFNFVSGGPGYVGDYYIIQGDALGDNPVQIIRQDGELRIL